MQKLLAFIVAKRHWFIFILCEVISFALIYRNNVYQRNMMLSSANVITGSISSVSGTVFSYFDLQKVNQELLERSSLLEMEVLKLREQLNGIKVDSTSFGQVFLKDTIFTDSLFSGNYIYEYITAGVVNNSTAYMNNYITINKGANDGIRPDMGVVSPQGIVGIVATVNDHYSVVISLLNVKFKVNCKVQHTNYFGALSWKGGDAEYAYLEQLPTHATFQTGDTIVTSGYSAVFPPGIMVGIVESYNKQNDDNFYSLKVRLATDFHSLNALCVIDNRSQSEQKVIEQEARKND
ncbi:MAG: rod shape-determining protein MreC [Tannerella sp.]|jgi:rod shape-determining protein MreC|nr:rod shape-determining protein MreC [Tannerella sp.]